MLIVKGEPELRHILAHLHQAIDALADGCVRVAKDELESVEGLLMYDGETQDQEECLKWLEKRECEKKDEGRISVAVGNKSRIIDY